MRAAQAIRDMRRLKCDASSGVGAQLKALELMKGNSDHILEKATRYKRVGVKKKQQSSMSKHKFAWRKEMKQLQAERHVLERDLSHMELPAPAAVAAAVDRERSQLVAATEAAGEGISNDYQEIVALVRFTQLRQGEEQRAMAAQCTEQMQAYSSRLREGLALLEREGDELEEEISALQRWRSAPAQAGHDPAQPGPGTTPRGCGPSIFGPAPALNTTAADRRAAGAAGSQPSLAGLLHADGDLAGELAALDQHFIDQLEQLRCGQLLVLRPCLERAQCHCSEQRVFGMGARHQYESGLPADIAYSPTGGWSKRAHEVFEKVLREFSRAGGRDEPALRPPLHLATAPPSAQLSTPVSLEMPLNMNEQPVNHESDHRSRAVESPVHARGAWARRPTTRPLLRAVLSHPPMLLMASHSRICIIRCAKFDCRRLGLELAAGSHEHTLEIVEPHLDWHDKQRFYHSKRKAHLRR